MKYKDIYLLIDNSRSCIRLLEEISSEKIQFTIEIGETIKDVIIKMLSMIEEMEASK